MSEYKNKPPKIFMDPYDDQDRMNALADKIKAQSASSPIILLPSIETPLTIQAEVGSNVIDLSHRQAESHQAA